MPDTPKGLTTVQQFGRDHWSTLLYIETVCTDHRGNPDFRRMRCDPDRHAHLCGVYVPSREKYPTRLADGSLLNDHDDWDCADDLEAAGFIRIEGSGVHPVFKMTDVGNVRVMELRKVRQQRCLTLSA